MTARESSTSSRSIQAKSDQTNHDLPTRSSSDVVNADVVVVVVVTAAADGDDDDVHLSTSPTTNLPIHQQHTPSTKPKKDKRHDDSDGGYDNLPQQS